MGRRLRKPVLSYKANEFQATPNRLRSLASFARGIIRSIPTWIGCCTLGSMEHAGFDGLHNPNGMLALSLSLLAITWIIIIGAHKVKAAMVREKAMRAEMKRAHEENKSQ